MTSTMRVRGAAAGLFAGIWLTAPAWAAPIGPDAVANIDAAQAAVGRQDWPAALPLLKLLVAQSPPNGKFRLQLGLARLGTHDFDGAIADFKAAGDLGAANPGYIAYEIASAYAQSARNADALAWIKTAMSAGYRALEDARSDSTFSALKDNPEYRAALGIIDPAKISRDDGWRTDVRFLADWVEKKSFHPFRTTTGDRTLSGARLTKEEFEAQVSALIAKIPNLSDGAAEAALFKLVACLGDGHTFLGGSHSHVESAMTLPIDFYDFDDGLFVVSAAPQYRDLVGAKILAFDDTAVADVAAKIDPLIPRDNAMWVRAQEPRYLRHLPLLQTLGIVKSDKKVTLTVLQGGKERSVEITADPTLPDVMDMHPKPAGWSWLGDGNTADFQTGTDKPFWMKWNGADKILYVQYNQVADGEKETLAEFAKELRAEIDRRPIDKLVLDMRNNNGGNTALDASVHAAIAGSAKVNARGHLYVIIGRRTFSAAMNSVSYLARDTKAVFVGEPTGGKPNAPGDVTLFTLPYSGMIVNLSDRFWQGSLPGDFSPWRAPDIAVPVLSADYAAGHDAAMEAIKAQRLGGETP